MLKQSFYILASFLLGSCASSEPSNTEEVQVATEEVKEVAEVLEFAPESYLNSIRARANGIEATMYTSGASFSVFDKNSVLAFTQQILLQAPTANTTNQIGHIMFLEDGNNILLAGVYHNGSDVFMRIDDRENGKTYYNLLIGKAKDLFTNVKVKPAE